MKSIPQYPHKKIIHSAHIIGVIKVDSIELGRVSTTINSRIRAPVSILTLAAFRYKNIYFLHLHEYFFKKRRQ